MKDTVIGKMTEKWVKERISFTGSSFKWPQLAGLCQIVGHQSKNGVKMFHYNFYLS